MISKKAFTDIINLYDQWKEEDKQFSESIQTFAHDEDFSGFYSERPQKLLELLNTLMGIDTKDDIISWWLMDAPDHGKCGQGCIVDPSGKSWDLMTAGDLYDYIVEEMGVTDTDLLEAQTNGVIFALEEIERLREDNDSLKDDGHKSARDSLLRLVSNRIQNFYFAVTDDDSVFNDSRTSRPIYYTKGNNE